MRYSIQSRERKYVKGCGFLLFTRKLGGKCGKKNYRLSNKGRN